MLWTPRGCQERREEQLTQPKVTPEPVFTEQGSALVEPLVMGRLGGVLHTPAPGEGSARCESRAAAGAAGSRMERPALGIVRFLPWRPPPSAHPVACDTGAQSDLAVPSTFLSARRCLRNGAPPSVRASALVLALLSPQSGGRGLGLGSPRRPSPSHARRPRAASCPSAARLVLTPEPCAARLSWAGQRWTLCSDRLLPKVEVLSPLPLQTSHSSAADQP